LRSNLIGSRSMMRYTSLDGRVIITCWFALAVASLAQPYVTLPDK